MSKEIDLNFNGLSITVTYYEEPEEKQTRDYPGYAGGFEVIEIEAQGLALLDFFERLDLLEQLEEEIKQTLN